ncbi:flagellar biosynthetic protein FliO [Candidatus Hydrogenedentota bacterium]
MRFAALVILATTLGLGIVTPALFAQDAGRSSLEAPPGAEAPPEASPSEAGAPVPYWETEGSGDSTGDSGFPRFNPNSTGGMFFNAIKALIIVLLLITITVYVMKKFHGGAAGIQGDSKSQVLNRIYLSPRASIFVVKVVDRILLLGVTPGSVQLLSEVTRPEEIARFEAGTSPFGGPLISAIKKSMQRPGTASPSREDALDDQLSKLKGQTERIRKIAEGESDRKE